MSTVKVIAGVVCFVATLVSLPLAWICFTSGPAWFGMVVFVSLMGLASLGIALMQKRRSPLSKNARLFSAVFVAYLLLSPVILVAYIRHERAGLQRRAIDFINRPIPSAVLGDAEGLVGYYSVGPNEDALWRSHAIVRRYADNGRIRWSATIQSHFAISVGEILSCEDADVVRTNAEARLYVSDCKAIVNKAWDMGFWQFVEDTITLKHPIPEHAEQDSKARQH